MYNIGYVKKANIDAVRNYLLGVRHIKEVDETILKNAIVLSTNRKIHAVVSYEILENYALVRYFVYKRDIGIELLEDLFHLIEEKLIAKNINYMFSLSNNKELFNLFSSLEFEETSEEDVLVFDNFSKINTAQIMIKKISTHNNLIN